MKVIRFVTRLGALLILCSLPLAAVAQDAASTRLTIITQHCKQLHNLLDAQQRRDLVSRTNLGREYETVDKELAAFTQRIHNNNLSNTSFQQLLSQFRDATSRFREAYIAYDDSLNSLQAINCQDRATDFDAQLTVTRGLRDTVEGTITHAAALVGQYRDATVQLVDQLPQSSSGTSGGSTQ